MPRWNGRAAARVGQLVTKWWAAGFHSSFVAAPDCGVLAARKGSLGGGRAASTCVTTEMVGQVPAPILRALLEYAGAAGHFGSGGVSRGPWGRRPSPV